MDSSDETTRQVDAPVVAHEMRTPIATLEGYLEGLLDGVIDPSDGRGERARRLEEASGPDPAGSGRKRASLRATP